MTRMTSCYDDYRCWPAREVGPAGQTLAAPPPPAQAQA